MATRRNDDKDISQEEGLTAFVIKRVLLAVFFIAAVLGGLTIGLEYFPKPEGAKDITALNRPPALKAIGVQTASTAAQVQAPVKNASNQAAGHAPAAADAASSDESAKPTAPAGSDAAKAVRNGAEGEHSPIAASPATPEHPKAAVPPVHTARSESKETSAPSKEKSLHGPAPQSTPIHRPAGVAFTEAVIKPMDNELNHRFWGWRPNDIFNVTDNINQFQLGVLEVTRRTVVQLAERISRTGYNDAFDHSLENAMNWLMIKASSYWFPSPETKYKESLSELEIYKRKLMAGKAYFHTRADNLIPLLAAYEDLLGSCDENLVKTKEADGSKVGFLRADDYFYYAKGVASAMATILEALSRDFATTLENRHGDELLHHAIASCHIAASLNPWVVTNGSLDGMLANHRANMAAPISHARFYLGQLIKTLST